ncbi:MAG: hypothetical protein ACI9IP_003079 [Arcticibacterium sp.]|jgi:hypothetical protein
MQKAKNILFSFLAFVLTTSVALAQVQGSQSRLDIGKVAKPAKISTNPLSSYVIRNKVPTEVTVNSNSAITEFYKDLLLKSSNKVIAKVKTDYEPEMSTKDYLYTTEELSISNIYPNPANDFATLDYSLSSNKAAKVAFYNILGGRVASFKLDSFDRQLRVETRNWDNGIYLYQLILDGKKMATKKLLVRHN